MVRRSRFQIPPQNLPRSERMIREDIIHPVMGLNTAEDPTKLKPGEAAEADNFQLEVDGSGIKTRDGLEELLGPDIESNASKLDDIAGIGVILSNDSSPKEGFWIESRQTMFMFFDSSNFLSATFGSASGSTDPNDFRDHAIGAVGTHQDFGTPNSLVVTSLATLPYHAEFSRDQGSPPSKLNLSNASGAKYVTSFAQRLVFFNCYNEAGSARTVLPRRVVWSARGDHDDYENGGAEDLVSMDGAGTGLVSERDRMVLTSTDEVWIARQRPDQYAFDFIPVDQSIGNPNPRTLKATPVGAMFVGPDLLVHRVAGNQVRQVGNEVQQKLRNEVREQDLMFATYDEDRRLYRVFYSDTTGNYPNRSVDLRIDTLQQIDNFRDRGFWFASSYRSNEFWGGDRGALASLPLSSASTARILRFNSALNEDFVPQVTSDTSSRYSSAWRSHALEHRDVNRKEAITDVWAEINSSGTTASFDHHLWIYSDLSTGETSSATAEVAYSGRTDVHFPVEPRASRHIQFEYRTPSGVTAGVSTEIRSFRVKLRSYTGAF